MSHAEIKNLDWFAAESAAYVDRQNGKWCIGEIARVIDVNSGKTFSAYRKGGTNHIDWEPAMTSDTAILLEICEDAWSWDSRPILVEIGSEIFAASMNVMPHGKQDIEDNNYDGHSCIHFLNSRTHGSNRVNKSHQKAILVALESDLTFN